jgi:uncharacterized protein (TIGR02466 family)
MTNSRKDWFPTPIWHFILDDCQQLNHKLLEEVKAEQQRDQKGEKKSNILGWHSAHDLHQRDGFAEFANIIGENTVEVANELHWDLQRISLKIESCWAIVNGKLASNNVHNHPNSVLSGVYYLQAPENSGVISFYDPRPAAQMLLPPLTEYSVSTLPKISYQPQAGTMLLFPSWLLHGVEMNLSAELRVSLSFNIAMLPLAK